MAKTCAKCGKEISFLADYGFKTIEFTKDNKFSLYKQIAQERIKRLQQATETIKDEHELSDNDLIVELAKRGYDLKESIIGQLRDKRQDKITQDKVIPFSRAG